MSTDITNPRTESASSEPAAGEHPIVFFDGVCGMCNKAVDFLMTRDRKHVLRFAPLQGETSRKLLNLPSDSEFSTMMLWERGRIYERTDAVWRSLAAAGGAWGVLAQMLRVIPRPLRNWGYGVVARNRHRFFGKKESCRLPKPEERALFLP